jgi:hypothetical protein
MVGTRKTRGWGGATVLVVLVTLVGAAVPAAGELYRQVYPGPDSGVVEPGKSIERALTRASLETGFDAEPVTEVYGAFLPRGSSTSRPSLAARPSRSRTRTTLASRY